ncbi:MAG: hypothetical protein ACK4SZ_09260 [Allosphingosinicella sp.]|uniref:hypothetical protein n=1 Tax=Allosphingosinicella sp. TaxID=2823234 RepID=UPI0039625819
MTRKLLLPLLIGAVALAAGPAQARERLSPEAQLARMLEGRVAGEPVDCINLRNVRGSSVIRDTAIVYDAGSVLYVNRPRAGAEQLDDWSAQVSRPFGNRLCSIDPVQLIDLTSGVFRGTVFLDEFVPYRRVRD